MAKRTAKVAIEFQVKTDASKADIARAVQSWLDNMDFWRDMQEKLEYGHPEAKISRGKLRVSGK